MKTTNPLRAPFGQGIMTKRQEGTNVRPQVLIWDWNGTVLDDWSLCFAIENEMLRERGMREITADWYLAHFSFPIRDYYAMMGYTFETESFERLNGIFMERYNARYTSCPLRAGVTGLLRKVQENGICQTLLSVTQQEDLVRQTNRLGAARYFTEILGQRDILGHSKVERAKRYIAEHGIDPKTALFVGDTDHDAETANAVGCACALLVGGHQSKDVLLRCGVPVFETLSELSDWMEL